MTSPAPAARSRSRPTLIAIDGACVDAEYAADDWEAGRLGVPARRGRNTVHFGVITQQWLREDIKRWSRFRLSTGYAFTSVDTCAQAMARFSEFLAERHPHVCTPAGISRNLLVDYLSWMASSRWAVGTRSNSLTFLKVFLEWGRRHGTLDGLPADAVIYEEEVTRPADALPKFIPEFVMAQLESEARLARITNPTVRHLVIVLMETGMRGGDACELAFNPMVDDSVGWPCLRFANSKVSTEQLIPLSAKAAETIRAQQAEVRGSAPAARRGCSPGSWTTPTAPSPTPTARCRDSWGGGRRESTCATTRAWRCGCTLISSATPWGPGSSTPACPSTSSRSCSATPVPA